jgi:ribosomal-protein-alanine N-acetyltransferase
MSAQFDQLNMQKEVQFCPMQLTDIDAIMQIEPTIYSHPWTRGNFSDSINSGYSAWMMMQGQNIIGYALMMLVLDEAHLLNLSIAKNYQKQGFGKMLLEKMCQIAKQYKAANMFLEVRASNIAAITLYENVGFNEMSIRRNYYPAHGGREDAVLMGIAL